MSQLRPDLRPQGPGGPPSIVQAARPQRLHPQAAPPAEQGRQGPVGQAGEATTGQGGQDAISNNGGGGGAVQDASSADGAAVARVGARGCQEEAGGVHQPDGRKGGGGGMRPIWDGLRRALYAKKRALVHTYITINFAHIELNFLYVTR